MSNRHVRRCAFWGLDRKGLIYKMPVIPILSKGMISEKAWFKPTCVYIYIYICMFTHMYINILYDSSTSKSQSHCTPRQNILWEGTPTLSMLENEKITHGYTSEGALHQIFYPWAHWGPEVCQKYDSSWGGLHFLWDTYPQKHVSMSCFSTHVLFLNTTHVLCLDATCLVSQHMSCVSTQHRPIRNDRT